MFYEQSIGDKILKESHKFEKKPIALDRYVLNLASRAHHIAKVIWIIKNN